MSQRPLPPAYRAYQVRIAAAGKVTRLGPVFGVVALVVLCFLILPDMVASIILGGEALAGFRNGTTALGLTLQLASFGIPLAFLLHLIRRVHRRNVWSVAGPVGAVLSGFVASALWVGGVLLAMQALPRWGVPDGTIMAKPVALWLLTLFPGLLALLIQTTAEEVFFRGYIQQMLAAYSPNRLIWLVLPNVAFGLIHFSSATGAVDGALWVIFAAGLGLACADLTARHGTIGPAIGLHLANNAFAFFAIGIAGRPQSGFALYMLPYQDPSAFNGGLAQLVEPWAVTEILISLVFVACLWLAARIAIRR
jgi:membrane protease YdiL (CAAX protease family)